jgi:hypothetical protein
MEEGGGPMSDTEVFVKIRIPRWRRAAAGSANLRRTVFALAALPLAAVLVAGHVAYWYMPRLREARPRPGLLPARLLASDDLPFAVWMPYPHQNLAMLEAAPSEGLSWADFSRALARLAGVPEPALPAFGSFRVPPSREIAFAADEKGERFALAAEVYPAVAAFAKLSGALADNRWLRGGELTVEGRKVSVAWHGRVWTVSSPAFPRLEGDPPGPSGPPSLLVAEARRPAPSLPPGRFHLTRQGRDLVFASAGAAPEGFAFEVPEHADLGLFLLVVSGGNVGRKEPIQAMAFFGRENPLTFKQRGVSFELPGMASIWETGGERWSLPGESLLEWSGRKARRTEIGRFSVAALDRRSFRRIQDLAPKLAYLVVPRREGRLAWGLWLDLAVGRLEISRIARVMEAIPLVSAEQRQRWRDTATVLEPVARAFSRVSLVVTEEPPAMELRFVGRE